MQCAVLRWGMLEPAMPLPFTPLAAAPPTPNLMASYGQAAVLRPEMKYKKPSFQYKLYQECGFLYLSFSVDQKSNVSQRDRIPDTFCIESV
eukprot:2412968-Rhodomonas_salina.1